LDFINKFLTRLLGVQKSRAQKIAEARRVGAPRRSIASRKAAS